jgi:hypothetical protein
MGGNWTAPNPPFGAVFTYNVAQALPPEARLVLTITDDSGRQARRLDIDRSVGLRRAIWSLRLDPGSTAAASPGVQPGASPGRDALQPMLAAPGRYRATLGSLVGDTVTAIGPSQAFAVVPIQ